MANRARAEIEASHEHAVARVHAEKQIEESIKKEQEIKEHAIAFISRLAGKIESLNFFRSQADFFFLVMLKQVKDAKEYRDKFGLTWEAFCESVGLKRRTVDENLQDLKPFKADFLAAFRQFSGVDFSKIKYLGYEASGGSASFQDNAIVYNGETIPVTPDHADEIQALLEKLEDEHKKQLEDKESELRAQKRILASKEDVIKKMEREIKRLEKTVEVSDLSPEEQEQIELLKELQGNLVSLISTVRQKIDYQKSSPDVLRQLYFLYIFGSKVFMDERMALYEVYADAQDVPWEITEMELPPPDILIDNLPLTKGMGKAYKEKIEARKK